MKSHGTKRLVILYTRCVLGCYTHCIMCALDAVHNVLCITCALDAIHNALRMMS